MHLKGGKKMKEMTLLGIEHTQVKKKIILATVKALKRKTFCDFVCKE